MYLTWIVYALCIALFVWGGKFAGFGKTQFHDDSASLDVTKSLRGFAALGVILHHISQERTFQMAGGGNGHPGELSIFVNAGFYFVAIFFFCSGFGLIKSFKNKQNYLDGFIKSRIVKTLLIPFYVNVIIYGIARFASGERLPVVNWITNLLGLTMMNIYAWYPVVAVILYLAFYFTFNNIKNQKVCFALIAAVILLMGVIFCINGHFAWWAGPKNWWLHPDGWLKAKWWMVQKVFWFSGEWWVNSAPAFFVGLMFGQFEDNIRSFFKKGYWLKIAAVLLLYLIFNMLSGLAQWELSYWSEWDGNGPGILNKLVCYLSQIPQVCFFVILLFVLMMKYYAVNPVGRFFGGISYETYMMNLIPIFVFRFLIYKRGTDGQPLYATGNSNLALYLLAVIAATVVLGLIFKLCNKLVYKLFKL